MLIFCSYVFVEANREFGRGQEELIQQGRDSIQNSIGAKVIQIWFRGFQGQEHRKLELNSELFFFPLISAEEVSFVDVVVFIISFCLSVLLFEPLCIKILFPLSLRSIKGSPFLRFSHSCLIRLKINLCEGRLHSSCREEGQ